MARYVEALERYRGGRLSCVSAAELLGISERHFRRLRERYEPEEAEGLTERDGGLTERDVTAAAVWLASLPIPPGPSPAPQGKLPMPLACRSEPMSDNRTEGSAGRRFVEPAAVMNALSCPVRYLERNGYKRAGHSRRMVCSDNKRPHPPRRVPARCRRSKP
jgi:Helix-turn-helix domain